MSSAKQNMLHISDNRGFTLLETLIYSLILAGFLVVAFSLTNSILGKTDALLERNEVLVNQELVERRIGWISSGASAIATPSAGEVSGSISFSMNDPSLDPAVVSVSGGAVMLSLGGGTAFPLTNDRVTVTAFGATHISEDGHSQARISFSLESSIHSRIMSSSTRSYVISE